MITIAVTAAIALPISLCLCRSRRSSSRSTRRGFSIACGACYKLRAAFDRRVSKLRRAQVFPEANAVRAVRAGRSVRKRKPRLLCTGALSRVSLECLHFYPKAQISTMAVQKMQVAVQKNQVNASFNLEQYASNKRRVGAGCWPSEASKRKETTMRTCALCHRKLGLGTRFRNVWNGRWWVHVRFCSARCEGIYEVKRNNEAKQRWHAFLARSSLRS